MENVILKAENISKFFNAPQRYQVLKNISLRVRKGEFVAIMGKSGCGKSTLLYVLSTLDTQYEGSLEINGMSLRNKSESELARFRNEHIGFVFQYHFLLPEFTVLENVMIPAMKLSQKKRATIEAEAIDTLTVMNMKNEATRLASQLSGGQQQRAAIARALMNDPGIIMADEPTGNLDSVNSAIVLGIFEKLSKEGHTIIAVTHDQDFAAKSDRVIYMTDGTIESGDPTKA